MGIKRYRSIAGRRTRHSAAWTPSTTALLGHRLMFSTRPAAPRVCPSWPWPWPWPLSVSLSAIHQHGMAWHGLAWMGTCDVKGPRLARCRVGIGGCCRPVPVPVPKPEPKPKPKPKPNGKLLVEGWWDTKWAAARMLGLGCRCTQTQTPCQGPSCARQN